MDALTSRWSSAMKVRKSVEEFLAMVQTQHAEKTYEAYRGQLKTWLAMFGSSSTKKLRKADVQRWLDAEVYLPTLAPDTQRARIVAWTQWAKFATERGHMNQPPMEKIKKPTGRKRERTVRPDEAAKILRRARRPFAHVYRALLRTGARPNEIARARIEDFDAVRSLIVLKEHKTARKTGESRKIGVGRKLRRLVDRCIAGRTEGPIFLNDRGQPWNANAMSHAFRRLREQLDLPDDIVLYCTRHTAGTAICRKLGIHAAAHALGHRTIQTTTRYAHAPDEDLTKYQDETF